MASHPAAAPETPAPPRRLPFSSPRDAAILTGLLLALGAFLVYEPTFHNGFVSFDDRLYVTQNPVVLRGLTWAGVRWALRTTEVDYWHPLTWLFHMAAVQIFGLRSAGHHLLSLLLHLANVVLLFGLLRKATGSLTRSALVAAFFAVCPLNVESVAWVAETKTLLCTLFLLLALWAYGSYARKPALPRLLGVLLLFGLGLMAKPMLVTFPILLLLVDFWPLHRVPPSAASASAFGPAGSWSPLLLEKLPFLFLSAASVYSTMRSQRAVGAVVSVVQYPATWRAKNVVWSYACYLFKAVWPAHLAAFYPFEGRFLTVAQVALAAAVLLAVSALIWCFRRQKYLIAGWLWYFVALLPVIGIVQAGAQGMADRYAYIPFWGIFAGLVWTAGDLASAARVPRSVLASLSACLLAGYSTVTVRQVPVWRDSISLFTHATQVTSGNAFAQENLGEALADAGRPAEALPHYEAAAADMPASSVVHYNLGAVYESQGRLADAIREYQLAAVFETAAPSLWQEHINLGSVHLQLGQFDDAIAEFGAAIRVEPDNLAAYKYRGMIEYSQKDFPAARDDLSRALQLGADAQAYYWMGRTLDDLGEEKTAVENYQAALKIEPQLAEAQARLDADLKKPR